MHTSKSGQNYLDDLAMLRAGVRFAQRVGRPPKRLDFREPTRFEWERQTGLVLPSADAAARRFGGWNAYLSRMGYASHLGATQAIQETEQAALAHCEDAYPGFDVVESDRNAYDAYVDFGKGRGPQRTEIKGSALQQRTRKDGPTLGSLFFSFKTHGRDLTSTVDAAVFVGLGRDPDSGLLEPLVRLEFPKSALRVIDSKSTIMIYANAAFLGGSSLYSPYIKWRKPGLRPARLMEYARHRAPKEMTDE